MEREISDDSFKSHVMKFIEVASQKFNGLTSDVRTNGFKLHRLESGLTQIEEKVSKLDEKVDRVVSDVKLVSGQFSDVPILVMRDNTRLDGLDKRLAELESGIH